MRQVKLNLPGFTELRRDPAIRAAVEAEAIRIRDRANQMGQKTHEGMPEYHVASVMDSQVGSIALATTHDDTAARIDNARNNTLLKAMGGG